MTKHILYTSRIKFIGLTAFIVTISLTVYGLIVYQKLHNSNDQLLQEFSGLQRHLDTRLQEQNRIFDLRLKDNRSSIDSTVTELITLKTKQLPDKDQNKLLDQLQGQKIIIANIVSYNQYLDKELKRLGHLINQNSQYLLADHYKVDDDQSIPINDVLNLEDKQAKQATAQMLAKIDSEFEQLSLETNQAKIVKLQA